MTQTLPEEPHFKHYEYVKNSKTPEKKGFTNKEKLIAAMSGLVLLLVVGGGIAANKVFNKTPQPTETEMPTTPVEEDLVIIENAPVVEVAPEVLPTVESLEVDASLISNPEELVKTLEEKRMTEWFNAGSTPENAKKWMGAEDLNARNEFIDKIASEYDQLFIKALFVEDWQSTPSLVKYIDRVKSIHKNTIKMYYMTSFPDVNPDDKEPYKRGVTVNEVHPHNRLANGTILETNGKIIITTLQRDYDNADKSRVGTRDNAGVTGEDNHPVTSYTVTGKTIKVSNVSY